MNKYLDMLAYWIVAVVVIFIVTSIAQIEGGWMVFVGIAFIMAVIWAVDRVLRKVKI